VPDQILPLRNVQYVRLRQGQVIKVWIPFSNTNGGKMGIFVTRSRLGMIADHWRLALTDPHHDESTVLH
jgi:hypothetical protein